MAEWRVAILGAGRMGQALARRLHEAGIAVQVWNRTPERLRPLAEAGLTVSEHLASVLADRNLWVTILADGSATWRVWQDAMRDAARAGVLWIQMATLDHATTLTLAHEAKACGLAFLDAPVLGGVGEALRGQLIIMVGGDGETLEAVRPVLSAWGHRIVHMGPVGTGTLAKLTSNLLLAHMMAGLAEWMNFGQRVGLDPIKLWEVIKHSKLYCPMYEGKFRMLYEEDFQPSFALKWMRKDLNMILDVARRFGAFTPVTDAITTLYEAAFNHGYGEEDYAAVHQILRALSRGGALPDVETGSN